MEILGLKKEHFNLTRETKKKLQFDLKLIFMIKVHTYNNNHTHTQAHLVLIFCYRFPLSQIFYLLLFFVRTSGVSNMIY